MFDLAGRCALVTGATGGIGGAIARSLHAAGATVILTGRRADALHALAEELGDRQAVIVADLGQPEEAERLIHEAEEVQALDILVNNAGVTRDTLAMRMKDADWDHVLETNLTAAFRIIRASLKGMMKRRYGRIINITSIVGVSGNPGQANYAASKAGLVGMSKSLAQEVAARGITVNCIAPGFIETAMTDALSDQQKETLLSRVPAGRLGDPDDIAAASVYLASAEASYCTGQTLHVNGGMLMV